MKIFSRLFIVAALLQPYLSSAITVSQGDMELTFGGTFRPESMYGKNVSFLNNFNANDKLWFIRHTLDLKFGANYGKEAFGQSVVDTFFSIRDRGVWGNPETIASTTFSEVKILDAITGSHNHAIPRHIFWMREGWLKLDVGEMLNFPMGYEYTFTLGAFSFQLGRGIALGDAYAVGPDLLGFYSESVVDQYAFGAKMSASVLENVFEYDLYTAILQNKTGSLGDTNAKVYGQAYGRLDTPARGFGSVNFLVAGRFMWHVFDSQKYGHLTFEPYALYNSAPEQAIEFTADASSKLGTLGLAGMYESDRFELAFDYAMNVGYQKVLGWDRNQIELENRDGTVVLVNSHVAVGEPNGDAVLFTGSSSADQRIINDTSESESQNGKSIGVTQTGELFNTKNRFRNPYTNRYEGWMFVADAAMYFLNRDLMVAVEAGVATGDDNPNNETLDGEYSGFISLQELYSGRNVRSAFLLGGAGKLKRTLSESTSDQAQSRFSDTVTGFTNIMYSGIGCKWEPKSWQKKIVLNPNILAYWQHKPTKAYDAKAKAERDCLASRYLGSEANVFLDYYIYKNMKMFVVGSIFFPGDHYRDIRGKPLSSEQLKALDNLDKTGFDGDRIPNLGVDKAFTFNVGFEYRF